VTSLVVIATLHLDVSRNLHPRWIPSIRRKDPAPRGSGRSRSRSPGPRLVSLAAALAIPLTIENGNPFPIAI